MISGFLDVSRVCTVFLGTFEAFGGHVVKSIVVVNGAEFPGWRHFEYYYSKTKNLVLEVYHAKTTPLDDWVSQLYAFIANLLKNIGKS